MDFIHGAPVYGIFLYFEKIKYYIISLSQRESISIIYNKYVTKHCNSLKGKHLVLNFSTILILILILVPFYAYIHILINSMIKIISRNMKDYINFDKNGHISRYYRLVTM